MVRSLRLPAWCALLFMVVVAAAEGAAILLAWWPASSALWFMNLEVFRSFHPGLFALEAALGGGAQLFWAACVGSLLAALAIIAEIELLGAVLSNVVLAACAVLAAFGRLDFLLFHRQADWTSMFFNPHNGQLPMAILLAITLAGAAASHLRYIGAMWRER